MKIAALQTVSTPRIADNLATARRLAETAAREGARLLVLPEYFCALGLADRDKLGYAERDGDLLHGPIQQAMSGLARELGVWLVAGTQPLATDAPERVRNATLVYAPDGMRAARYDKIHLFRYDNGRERYDEGATLEPGTDPVTFEVPDDDGTPLRVGLSVCYDLRFPELYRTLSTPAAPCDLLLVPAAFTATTGRAHWEVLLRARAIENQCYVLAAAQGGRHENGRQTWGHSMAVDPWGEVLALQARGEGVVLAEVDRRRIAQVRTQLPAWEHRMLG